MVCIMNILRHLPAIHELKAHSRFTEMVLNIDIAEDVLTEWLDEQVDLMRNKIRSNKITDQTLNREKLTELIFDALEQKVQAFKKNNLQKVVNATGVVLHTNLGRARLSKRAIEHISNTASSYSTLEYQLSTGKRGSRHDIVEDYLKQITGAEAAMVVNNNAAAVYLVLKALACDQEVIVSRGELVEIGGSFRISAIMEESGAKLVEVGTTNKTYASDYERAITEETALLMKVHKSNFSLIGFTKDVDTTELVNISKEKNIPIYEDLGSGTLFDFKKHQIGTEPTVQEKVNLGIDVISFSGDKLLGGPQAGVIVGKKPLIEKMKKHQLARVLRVDKFTLAGIEGTLKPYLKGQAENEIPTVRDILETDHSVLEKAQTFIEKVSSRETEFTFHIERDKSKVGGGTMPDVDIDTFVVKVNHQQYTSKELAEKLRFNRIPIIVRVKHDDVILDFRTVHMDELDIVIEAFLQMEEEI